MISKSSLKRRKALKVCKEKSRERNQITKKRVDKDNFRELTVNREDWRGIVKGNDVSSLG